MKIYVSLPMSGCETSVKSRYEKAVKEIKERFDNPDIYAATNINEFTAEGIDAPHDWAYYMARDIEPLLRCDSIFLTKGYINSKGCKLELAIAKHLNLDIYYSKDAYKSL